MLLKTYASQNDNIMLYQRSTLLRVTVFSRALMLRSIFKVDNEKRASGLERHRKGILLNLPFCWDPVAHIVYVLNIVFLREVPNLHYDVRNWSRLDSKRTKMNTMFKAYWTLLNCWATIAITRAEVRDSCCNRNGSPKWTSCDRNSIIPQEAWVAQSRNMGRAKSHYS